MSLALSFNLGAPSGSASASRKRKRRRRSTSVFTSASASTEVSRPDDELETAKAAAMKLLDNSHVDSVELGPVLFGSNAHTDPVDALMPPKAKRTRFEDITTILEESEETARQQTATSEKQADTEHSPQVCLIGPSRDQNQQQKRCVIQPIIAPATEFKQNATSEDAQTEVFQVNREEIFSDNSIVDAFNAAILEFQFCRLEQSSTQLVNSIRLPHSRVEKRQSSALYYGKPPPCPPIRNKKPPLHSIFTAPLPPSPSTSKDTNAPAPAPVTPPRASPVCSELDMDEYLDMFGQPSSPEPADASVPAPPPRTSPVASESDMDECMDMFEQSPSPEPAAPTFAVKNGARLSTAVHEGDKLFDMSSGSSSSTKNGVLNPASATTAPTSVHSPTPCLPASEQLSAAQKTLLSNALNAQYWAGYHTALFNRSIGIGVEIPRAQDTSSGSGEALAQSGGWDLGKQAAASAPLLTG